MIKERSAGIVLVKNNNEYKFLILRAFKTFWDFPKGHIEANESPIDAAIRETYEETGISSEELNFKWGLDNYTTKPFKKNTKIVTYFIAETNKEKIILPINPKLGYPEHDMFKWVTYEEGKSIVNDRINLVLTWANNKI